MSRRAQILFRRIVLEEARRLREDRAKKYRKVMNSETQVVMNVAFDELFDRILLEQPKRDIDVTIGRVRARYESKNGVITISVMKS